MSHGIDADDISSLQQFVKSNKKHGYNAGTDDAHNSMSRERCEYVRELDERGVELWEIAIRVGFSRSTTAKHANRRCGHEE